MIKVIFTDFDGTLVDSRRIHEQAIIETLDKYSLDYNKKKLLSLLGIRLNIIFKSLGIRIKNYEKFRNEFYDSLTDKTSNQTIKKAVSLIPLRKLELPIIVISNSKTKYVEKAISVLKIAEFIDNIYGEEKFNSKQAMIKRLIKKYRISPKEALYMGDSAVDVEVARAVGCYAIAISNKNSWSNHKQLKKERPDFIIKDYENLNEIIREINRRE